MVPSVAEAAEMKTGDVIAPTSNNDFIQSTLDPALGKDRTDIEIIQSDINDIKLMLTSLSLLTSPTPKQQGEGAKLETSCISESNSLAELIVPGLKIEITDEEGCRVQCLTCYHYQQSSIQRKFK